MQGCADFMRLWRNFMPRQFSSIIFYYHLFIGEVWTIRNETTYPIHGKYPLNLNNTKKRMNQNFDTPSCCLLSCYIEGMSIEAEDSVYIGIGLSGHLLLADTITRCQLPENQRDKSALVALATVGNGSHIGTIRL